MGCTSHATLSVSGEKMFKTERTFVRGELATETLVVQPLI